MPSSRREHRPTPTARTRAPVARCGGLALALLLAACGEDSPGDGAGALPPLEVPEGCQPLAAEWDCLLPFPSDHWRVPDGALPGGHRVRLTEQAAPRTRRGSRADLTRLHPADGFSPGSQLLVRLPGSVRDDELTFHTGDIDATLRPGSSTLLLDTVTGSLVPHFAEVDPRAQEDEDRGLVLRPLVRLADGRRYVVALQGLRSRSGDDHVAPEGFRRMRDGQSAGDPVLSPLAARYETEVFAPLAAAGVLRERLLLAWDFTTRTAANATGDLLAVRQAALESLSSTLRYEITSVTDDVDERVARRVDGTVEVPLFLERDEPYAPLHRDTAGRVATNGVTRAAFTVLVPRSVAGRAPGSPPGRLLQYGHGFFGSREELLSHPAELAEQHGFVVVGSDWIGMSEEDRTAVVERLTGDTENVMGFTDRLHQAFANAIVVGALAQGPLAADPALQVPAGAAYDPSALYFHGNSLGHLLGGTYVALSPAVERAVLGVGGTNFSFVMFRAQPFSLFLVFMGVELPSFLDQQRLSYMTQLSFDRIDSFTYLPHLLGDTLPGSPPERRVLLQIGVGDVAVPPLSAHLQARSLGVPLLAPAVRPVYGLEERAGPFEGSALVEFDFGVRPEPGVQAIPPTVENQVHEGVRRLPATREQLSRFLRPEGRVEATCVGPCDPE